MKKFRFSLQTLHNLREARRDEAERALARTAAASAEAAETLDETKRAHARASETYAVSLREGEINPFEATLSVNYIASLLRRERDDRARLKERERAHESQRKMTADAAREAEATSRLRDRQRERHRLETERTEQVILDEMATLSRSRVTAEETA
jgi:flagellar export protein FliJ